MLERSETGALVGIQGQAKESRMVLTNSVNDVAEGSQRFDVVVVGTGAGGGSVAERSLENGLRVLMLERGERVVDTHVNNQIDNGDRAAFIKCFKSEPWTGDMKSGMQLRMFGGRTIAAGANMVRFYPEDFSYPGGGSWPSAIVDRLPGLYADVERDRRVSRSAVSGEPQSKCETVLRELKPRLPNVSVDLSPPKGFNISKGYDSSPGRLIPHLLRDTIRNPKPRDRRFVVATGAYAVRVVHTGSRVTAIECIDPKCPGRLYKIYAGAYVLAASTVESAKLVLASGVGSGLPSAGMFLAEHIERRAKIALPLGGDGDAISMVLPPPSSDSLDRYQIHLRGSRVRGAAEFIVDIGGFAAMDPQAQNRVTLSDEQDAFGFAKAHTSLRLTSQDLRRAERLSARIAEVGEMLGGRFITEHFPHETTEPRFTDAKRRVQAMPAGRSYHESGTLRIGGSPESGAVTDITGKVFGFENLYVADASLFPSVGVANPMLTISALSYLVADTISQTFGQSAAATA
jgi:choline dehydrogenase-like flavoprotein